MCLAFCAIIKEKYCPDPQVVEAGVDWKSGQPLLSSVVQVRGSIPLPWAQRPDSSVYRPEIVLHRFDPLYAATRRHFDQLR